MDSRELADVSAWIRLVPLLTEYLPFTGQDLRPAGLTVLLDDIGRPGELTVMDRWRREFALRLRTEQTIGYALLTP